MTQKNQKISLVPFLRLWLQLRSQFGLIVKRLWVTTLVSKQGARS